MTIFNAFIAYKFLRILSTPFDKTNAFKEGVIDKNGNQMISRSKFTKQQKHAYTIFHHLIFKLKKVMHKIPILKSHLGSFATALWFIKETIKEEYGANEAQMIEEVFVDHLKKNGYDVQSMVLNETFTNSSVIEPGTYIFEGKKYQVGRTIHSFDSCLGLPLFRLDKDTVVTRGELT